MQTQELYSINYIEQRVIGRIIEAHRKELGDKLHAVVAFGEQLTQGNTFDIDLLEVVDEWGEDRVVEFSSTAELPLRGVLRLYFLQMSEFSDPETITDNKPMRDWVEKLLNRVREGYQILLQSPPNYAEMALMAKTNISMWSAPASGLIQMRDPFSLPNSVFKAR